MDTLQDAGVLSACSPTGRSARLLARSTVPIEYNEERVWRSSLALPTADGVTILRGIHRMCRLEMEGDILAARHALGADK